MSSWILWTVLTLLSWGVWAILFRMISADLSPAHSQLISTLGIVPILAALWWIKEGPISGNRRRGIVLALGSGVFSCLGNIACYEALKHAKAATVIPLTALYPLVTVLLAIPLLKEHLRRLQWLGIGLSLAAIYLFNVPQGSDAERGLASGWILLPLLAVVLWGVTGLMQKASTNDISARSSAMWFLAAFFPVAGMILRYDPLPSGIAPQSWALATMMGFTVALGNLTILLAFSAGGKASIIAPLAGLYPLVSIPIALIVFDETLDLRESLGIALAMAAVVMLSFTSEPDGATRATIQSDTPS